MDTDFKDRANPEIVFGVKPASDDGALLTFAKATATSSRRLGQELDDTVVLEFSGVALGFEQELVNYWWTNYAGITTDFVASSRTYMGPWRTTLVEPRVITDREGGRSSMTIRITLSYGYYTSLNWDAARLNEDRKAASNDQSAMGIGNTTSHNPSRIITVAFPYISPAHCDTILAAIDTTTINGFTIRGEVFSGDWDLVVAGSRIEEDKSRTILLVISRRRYTLKTKRGAGLPREMESYEVRGVRKDHAQTILDAWHAANPSGSASQGSWDRDAETVDLILSKRSVITFNLSGVTTGVNCRYSEVTSWSYGVLPDAREAKLAEMIAVYGDLPTQGITYSVRQSFDTESGLFDLMVTFQFVQYRRIEAGTVVENAEARVTQIQQLGLTTQAMESMAEEDGIAKTRDVNVRDDCSKDVTTNREEGKLQTGTMIQESAAERVEVEMLDNATDPLANPVQTLGQIIQVEDSKIGVKYPNRRRQQRRVVTDKNQTGRRATESAAESVLAEINTATSVSASTSRTLGEIVRISEEPRPSGLKTVMREVVVEKDQTGRRVSDSAAASSVAEVHTATATPVSTARAKGEIIRVSEDPRPSGLNSTVREVIIPKDQVGRTTRNSSEEFVEEVQHSENPSTLADAPEVVGKISERIVVPTEAGNNRTIEKQVTLKRREATATSGNALETREVIEVESDTVDQSTEPDAPVGQNVETSSSPSTAGLYRNRKITKTAKSKEYTAIQTGGTAFFSETENVRRNKTSVDHPRQSGVIRSASIDMDSEFGLLQSREQERTPIQQLIAERVVQIDEFSQTLREDQYNADTLPAATQVDGEMSVVGGMNDFGKYDYFKSVKTARADVLTRDYTWTTYSAAQWAVNNEQHYIDWFAYTSTEAKARSAKAGTLVADDFDYTYGLRTATRSIAYYRMRNDHRVKYFANEEDAIAYISGVASSDPTGSFDASHSRVADGVWRVETVKSTREILTEIGV